MENLNNMEEKFNIKTQIYYEIQKLTQKKNIFEESKVKFDIYHDIIPIILTNDFEKIKENYITINLGLGVVLGNIESDNIIENFYEYIIALDILTKSDSIDSKDYNNNRRNFEEIKKILLTKYENLKKDIITYSKEQDNISKLIKSYNIILRNYTHNGLILDWQFELINNLLEKYDVDIKEKIRVCEYTRIHNQKIQNPNYKTSYTVNNMLQNQYSKYNISKLDYYNYNENTKLIIDSYFDIIKQSKDVFINLLEDLSEQYEDFYEFEYIIKNISNKFIELLELYVEEMTEYYNDELLRKVIIEEYNTTRYKYIKIKNFYENLVIKKMTVCDKNNQPCKENNLFFLVPKGGREPYLYKDLKDIPNEKLFELKQLLLGLENGTLSLLEDKQFTSHKKLRNYRELKGDQIRILYKNLFENNKLIIGSFIKKSDNYIKAYQKMINRDDSLFDLNHDNLEEKIEEHEEHKTNTLKYIEENARKGSR